VQTILVGIAAIGAHLSLRNGNANPPNLLGIFCFSDDGCK
jgi:hypothetical protein